VGAKSDVTQLLDPGVDLLPDPSIRSAKHIYGCVCVVYNCARTHRAITGLMEALLSSQSLPG
jgi:hypothetical protein